ncbi:anti-sigma factor family protein [Microvirga massiliensis]|uniref:anti-sigma factor family protein n=1 Tax=Microvirga massiliensis TaxID=1033741 RepID=UPI00062B7F89|nr:anti-sigma factor [Microvirga massiliensis]
MTRPPRPIGEDDLQAYVDDRLASDRLPDVEAHIRDNPATAERVASYRAQRQELRERLCPIALEPLPARLRISSLVAERRAALRSRMRSAVAACLWLSVGVSVGWIGNVIYEDVAESRLSTRLSAVTREAISAHRLFANDTSYPVEVLSDRDKHLAAWLSKRLGHTLVVPDLSGHGLRLVGGRILPAGQDAAAQLMYQDVQGSRVTFYIRTGEVGEAPLRAARHDDVQAFVWIDDGCGYVVAAALDRDQLFKIAQAIHEQLERAA